MSREDADRAVKDLDGKELRGRPVRVSLDESVRRKSLFLGFLPTRHSANSALVLIITVVMIAVMTGTATEKIGMTGIAVTVPGHLPAVVIMKIVVPGLHPRRGIMMIEGL